MSYILSQYPSSLDFTEDSSSTPVSKEPQKNLTEMLASTKATRVSKILKPVPNTPLISQKVSIEDPDLTNPESSPEYKVGYQTALGYSGTELFGGVKVKLLSNDLITPFQKAGRDIAIIVDKSGSMRHSMDKVKEAALTMLKMLNPEDRITFCSYDIKAKTTPLAKCTQANIEVITKTILGLEADGETSIVNGLDAAFKALDVQSAVRPVLMWLMTDGEDSGENMLNLDVWKSHLQEVKKSLALRGLEAVKVSVFGLGAEVNTPILSTIASELGGEYNFAENCDQLAQAFMRGILKSGQIARKLSIAIKGLSETQIGEVWAQGYTAIAAEKDSTVLSVAPVTIDTELNVLFKVKPLSRIVSDLDLMKKLVNIEIKIDEFDVCTRSIFSYPEVSSRPLEEVNSSLNLVDPLLQKVAANLVLGALNERVNEYIFFGGAPKSELLNELETLRANIMVMSFPNKDLMLQNLSDIKEKLSARYVDSMAKNLGASQSVSTRGLYIAPIKRKVPY